jgi:hypothetical protein
MKRVFAVLLATVAFAAGTAVAQDPPSTASGGPNPKNEGPKVPTPPGSGAPQPVLPAAGTGGALPQRTRLPIAAPADLVAVDSLVSDPVSIPKGAKKVMLWLTVKNVSNGGGAAGSVVNGVKMKIFRTSPAPEVLEVETTVVNLAPGKTQKLGQLVNVAPVCGCTRAGSTPRTC